MSAAVLGRARRYFLFTAGALDAAEQIRRGAANGASGCARSGRGWRGPRRGRGCCWCRSRCGGVQRLDDFFHLAEGFPISEAIGPEIRLCADLASVVRNDDLGDREISLIAFAEVDRVLRARVLFDGARRRCIRRFAGCRVHVRGAGLAVDDDGGPAFATPNLGQTISNFFVCNRVLSLARRTGNLHNQPRGCAFLEGKAVRFRIPESASLNASYAYVQFSVSAGARAGPLFYHSW